MWGEFRQSFLVFRAYIKLIGDKSGTASRNGQSWSGVANNIVAGLGLTRAKSIYLIRLRDPGADKVVLQDCYPTTNLIRFERIFSHIVKIELAKTLLGPRCG